MPHHDPIPPRAEGKAAEGKGIANPHAWARFRRIMGWMLALAIVCVGATLTYLRLATGSLPLQMAIASSLGVFLTVLVGTGLMSLVFLSAGSGHDADVADPFDEHDR
jgi:hypothetical protein